MSSPLKDARWQLATQNAEALGLVWDEMAYVEKDNFLFAAQKMLEIAPDAVPALAKKWNTQEEVTE